MVKARDTSVGDEISYMGTDGYVGEKGENGNIFFWSNNPDRDGSTGDIHPSTRGFRYSWYISDGEHVEIIKTKKTIKIMRKIGLFMKKLLDSDTQALVKAGYVNGDLELTPEGQNALNVISFEANKTALVKMAEEVIAEAEKESSK